MLGSQDCAQGEGVVWRSCAPPQPPRLCLAEPGVLRLCLTEPDVLRCSCSVLKWGKLLRPPQPPRLCLAGCAPPNPPASVWRSPEFFVVLVQFYNGGHGGRLRAAQPPRYVWRGPTFFVVLVQFYHGGPRLCLTEPDVLRCSCSVE